MPRMEGTCGTNIWIIQASNYWMVGWIHQLDTKCAITSDINNGGGEQTQIPWGMATKGQYSWRQLPTTMCC